MINYSQHIVHSLFRRNYTLLLNVCIKSSMRNMKHILKFALTNATVNSKRYLLIRAMKF